MPSIRYYELTRGLKRLERTFLPFKSRPVGNYTARQLAMAAAYTVFCHAEFETFLENWARTFVDLADQEWKLRRATRPLVHLCTFHEGRNPLVSVPEKDVWGEVVGKAIAKHRGVIGNNHGIKIQNFCELLSPIGFDTTSVDSLLLGDLNTFGGVRGGHAHASHKIITGTAFDPFDLRAKVQGIHTLLLTLDGQLEEYFKVA